MNADLPQPIAGEPRQQSAFEYIRSGQTPFFRLPIVDPARVNGLDGDIGAVLLGAPYDGGSTYQSGARLAPYHVRRVSALVQSFHPVYRLDVFAHARAVDGGNVPCPPFDPAATRDLIRREVALVVAAGAVPFLVGGDHSVALPALRAIAERFGPLAVVHVDAHLDTSDAATWGERYHHGAPLRHALDEGLVAAGQLYQIGIRAPSADEDEASWSQRHGALVFGPDEVAERGIARLGRDIRQRIGRRKVYLTFDVDAVDPAHAPGTGTPVPGGLSAREAIGLLRSLAGVDLVGMDLVEVAPALDHADITCVLAAHLLYEGVALAALGAR
jgi:agmatinase